MWKISLRLMNLASAESRDAFVWTRKKHEDRSRDININLIRQMFKGIQLRFFRRIQTDFEWRTRRMFCGTRLRANWSEMPLILLRLVVGWHFEKSHFINILMSRHPCNCESSTFPFKHLVKHFSQSFRLEERGKRNNIDFSFAVWRRNFSSQPKKHTRQRRRKSFSRSSLDIPSTRLTSRTTKNKYRKAF